MADRIPTWDRIRDTPTYQSLGTPEERLHTFDNWRTAKEEELVSQGISPDHAIRFYTGVDLLRDEIKEDREGERDFDTAFDDLLENRRNNQGSKVREAQLSLDRDRAFRRFMRGDDLDAGDGYNIAAKDGTGSKRIGVSDRDKAWLEASGNSEPNSPYQWETRVLNDTEAGRVFEVNPTLALLGYDAFKDAIQRSDGTTRDKIEALSNYGVYRHVAMDDLEKYVLSKKFRFAGDTNWGSAGVGAPAMMDPVSRAQAEKTKHLGNRFADDEEDEDGTGRDLRGISPDVSMFLDPNDLPKIRKGYMELPSGQQLGEELAHFYLKKRGLAELAMDAPNNPELIEALSTAYSDALMDNPDIWKKGTDYLKDSSGHIVLSPKLLNEGSAEEVEKVMTEAGASPEEIAGARLSAEHRQEMVAQQAMDGLLLGVDDRASAGFGFQLSESTMFRQNIDFRNFYDLNKDKGWSAKEMMDAYGDYTRDPGFKGLMDRMRYTTSPLGAFGAVLQSWNSKNQDHWLGNSAEEVGSFLRNLERSMPQGIGKLGTGIVAYGALGIEKGGDLLGNEDLDLNSEYLREARSALGDALNSSDAIYGRSGRWSRMIGEELGLIVLTMGASVPANGIRAGTSNALRSVQAFNEASSWVGRGMRRANFTNKLGAETLSQTFARRTYFGIQASRSAEATYVESYEKWYDAAIAAGLSPEAAKDQAENRAFTSGAVAGVVTGALMKAIPGGTERLFERGSRITAENAAKRLGLNKEKIAEVFATPAFRKELGGLIVSKWGVVPRELGQEAVEEFADEFTQGVIAQMTYDPQRDMKDIFHGAFEAAVVGALLGGGTSAATVNSRPAGELTPDAESKLERLRELSLEIFPNHPEAARKISKAVDEKEAKLKISSRTPELNDTALEPKEGDVLHFVTESGQQGQGVWLNNTMHVVHEDGDTLEGASPEADVIEVDGVKYSPLEEPLANLAATPEGLGMSTDDPMAPDKMNEYRSQIEAVIDPSVEMQPEDRARRVQAVLEEANKDPLLKDTEALFYLNTKYSVVEERLNKAAERRSPKGGEAVDAAMRDFELSENEIRQGVLDGTIAEGEANSTRLRTREGIHNFIDDVFSSDPHKAVTLKAAVDLAYSAVQTVRSTYRVADVEGAKNDSATIADNANHKQIDAFLEDIVDLQKKIGDGRKDPASLSRRITSFYEWAARKLNDNSGQRMEEIIAEVGNDNEVTSRLRDFLIQGDPFAKKPLKLPNLKIDDLAAKDTKKTSYLHNALEKQGAFGDIETGAEIEVENILESEEVTEEAPSENELTQEEVDARFEMAEVFDELHAGEAGRDGVVDIDEFSEAVAKRKITKDPEVVAEVHSELVKAQAIAEAEAEIQAEESTIVDAENTEDSSPADTGEESAFVPAMEETSEAINITDAARRQQEGDIDNPLKFDEFVEFLREEEGMTDLDPVETWRAFQKGVREAYDGAQAQIEDMVATDQISSDSADAVIEAIAELDPIPKESSMEADIASAGFDSEDTADPEPEEAPSTETPSVTQDVEETETAIEENTEEETSPVVPESNVIELWHGSEASGVEQFSTDPNDSFGDRRVQFGMHVGPKSQVKHEHAYKVKVHVKNPLRMEDADKWTASNMLPQLGEVLTEDDITQVNRIKAGPKRDIFLKQLLQSKGYDSIVYSNEFEGSNEDAYIVFEPSQVVGISYAAPDAETETAPETKEKSPAKKKKAPKGPNPAAFHKDDMPEKKRKLREEREGTGKGLFVVTMDFTKKGHSLRHTNLNKLEKEAANEINLEIIEAYPLAPEGEPMQFHTPSKPIKNRVQKRTKLDADSSKEDQLEFAKKYARPEGFSNSPFHMAVALSMTKDDGSAPDPIPVSPYFLENPEKINPGIILNKAGTHVIAARTSFKDPETGDFETVSIPTEGLPAKTIYEINDKFHNLSLSEKNKRAANQNTPRKTPAKEITEAFLDASPDEVSNEERSWMSAITENYDLAKTVLEVLNHWNGSRQNKKDEKESQTSRLGDRFSEAYPRIVEKVAASILKTRIAQENADVTDAAAVDKWFDDHYRNNIFGRREQDRAGFLHIVDSFYDGKASNMFVKEYQQANVQHRLIDQSITLPVGVDTGDATYWLSIHGIFENEARQPDRQTTTIGQAIDTGKVIHVVHDNMGADALNAALSGRAAPEERQFFDPDRVQEESGATLSERDLKALDEIEASLREDNPDAFPEDEEYIDDGSTVYMTDDGDYEHRTLPSKAPVGEAAMKELRRRIRREINELGLKDGDSDSLRTALLKIKSSKKYPRHYRRIANMLLKSDTLDLSLVDLEVSSMEEAAGMFFEGAEGKNDKVKVSDVVENGRGVHDVVIHELIHASFDRLLKSPANGRQKKVIEAIDSYMDRARQYLDHLRYSRGRIDDWMRVVAAREAQSYSIRKIDNILSKSTSDLAEEFSLDMHPDEKRVLFEAVRLEHHGVQSSYNEILQTQYALGITADGKMLNQEAARSEFVAHLLTDEHFQWFLKHVDAESKGGSLWKKALRTKWWGLSGQPVTNENMALLESVLTLDGENPFADPRIQKTVDMLAGLSPEQKRRAKTFRATTPAYQEEEGRASLPVESLAEQQIWNKVSSESPVRKAAPALGVSLVYSDAPDIMIGDGAIVHVPRKGQVAEKDLAEAIVQASFSNAYAPGSRAAAEKTLGRAEEMSHAVQTSGSYDKLVARMVLDALTGDSNAAEEFQVRQVRQQILSGVYGEGPARQLDTIIKAAEVAFPDGSRSFNREASNDEGYYFGDRVFDERAKRELGHTEVDHNEMSFFQRAADASGEGLDSFLEETFGADHKVTQEAKATMAYRRREAQAMSDDTSPDGIAANLTDYLSARKSIGSKPIFAYGKNPDAESLGVLTDRIENLSEALQIPTLGKSKKASRLKQLFTVEGRAGKKIHAMQLELRAKLTKIREEAIFHDDKIRSILKEKFGTVSIDELLDSESQSRRVTANQINLMLGTANDEDVVDNMFPGNSHLPGGLTRRQQMMKDRDDALKGLKSDLGKEYARAARLVKRAQVGDLASAVAIRKRAQESYTANAKIITDSYWKGVTDLMAKAATQFRARQNVAASELVKISPELVRSLNGMRATINRLQTEVLESDLLDRTGNGDKALIRNLKAKMHSSKGVYLTRTYQGLDEQNWDRFLQSLHPEAQKRVNKAYKFFRSQLTAREAGFLMDKDPNLTERQARAKIAAAGAITSDMVVEATRDFLSSFLRGGAAGVSAGQVNVNVLQPRNEEIAPELRDLVGQYRDNVFNASQTVIRLGSMLANDNFLSGIQYTLEKAQNEARKNDPKALFISDKSEKGLVAFVSEQQAKMGGSESYGALAHKFGPPEIVQALEDMRPARLVGFHRAIMTYASFTMGNMTTRRLRTHVRNFNGNPMFLVNAGMPLRAASAWLGTPFTGPGSSMVRNLFRTHKGGKVDKALTRLFPNQSDPYAQEMFHLTGEYAEEGVTGTDVHTNQIADIRRNLRDENIADPAFGFFTPDMTAGLIPSSLKKKVLGGDAFLTKSYQMGDDWWKITSYEANLEDLSRAFGLVEESKGSRFVTGRAMSPKALRNEIGYIDNDGIYHGKMTEKQADAILKEIGLRQFRDKSKVAEEAVSTPEHEKLLAKDKRSAALKALRRASAYRVRKTMPNYGATIEFVRMLKKHGITAGMAPFISFRAEIARIAFDTPALAAREIRSDNAGIRRMGWKRAMGYGFTMTVSPMVAAGTVSLVYALAKGVAEGMGLGGEDEEEVMLNQISNDSGSSHADDLKRFISKFYRDGTIAVLDQDPDGTTTWMDLSYVLPHSAVVDPVWNFIKSFNDPTKSSFTEFQRSSLALAKPYFNEQLWVAALMEGQKDSDGILAEVDPNPFLRVIKNGWRPLADITLPGTLSDVITLGQAAASGGDKYRYGRKIDFKEELFSQLAGTKIVQTDIADRFQRKLGMWNVARRDAQRQFTSLTGSRTTLTEKQLTNALDSSTVLDKRVVANAHRDFLAAQARLPEGEAMRILKESDLPREMKVMVASGLYTPWTPTQGAINRAFDAAKAIDNPGRAQFMVDRVRERKQTVEVIYPDLHDENLDSANP